MKHLNSVLLSSLIASSMIAQVSPATPGGTIAGHVVDALIGQPIKLALVQLRPETESARSSQSKTDENGKFSFDNIAPGRYRLSASKNGYLRQDYGAKLPNHPGTLLEIRQNEKLSDAALRLTAQAVVSGKVVDDSGEPVTNVNVQAMRKGFANGSPQLSIAKGALTNDLGEYRIFGLDSGRYYISAVAPDLSSTSGSAVERSSGRDEEGYVPVFYPGATDVAGATEVEVSGGQTYQGADFRLRRTRTVRIRGVVQNTVAVRPGRIMIRLMPRNSGMFGIVAGKFTSRLGSKGEFELANVPPGSYVLSADCYEGSNRYSARRLLDVGSSAPEDIKLVIGPGADVAGQVQIEANKSANLSAIRIKLTPSDSAMFESKEAVVRADGSFVVPHVPADTYTLEIRNFPDGVYLKSAKLGEQDVLKSGLIVPEGAFSGKIEVAGSENGGKIEGSVLTAEQKTATGASVVVLPDAEGNLRSDVLRRVNADQNGNFSLAGIAPGKYRAFALESVDDLGVFLNPSFRRRLLDLGQSLQVDEKRMVRLELKLIPESKILAAAGN